MDTTIIVSVRMLVYLLASPPSSRMLTGLPQERRYCRHGDGGAGGVVVATAGAAAAGAVGALTG
jgi:hypothetical protein